MLDYTLEEVGALLLPVDAGEGLLDAIGWNCGHYRGFDVAALGRGDETGSLDFRSGRGRVEIQIPTASTHRRRARLGNGDCLARGDRGEDDVGPFRQLAMRDRK